MDNVKQFLESGLIESYLMGLCTDREEVVVQYYIKNYPEVQQAISDYEEVIEKVAKENAQLPPQMLRQNILDEISQSEPNFRGVPPNYTGWLMAASLIGFLVVSGLYFSQSNGMKEAYEKLAILEEDCIEMRQKKEENDVLLAFIQDEQTTLVSLDGKVFKKDADVVVFWNREEEYAYLDIKMLPEIKDNETYQIWADKDGEMISRGTFDMAEEFVKIKFLEDAESLNITIEPKGGSKEPTVSRLVANGYIT